jgi:chromatin remodeling complex protein RSC6
VCGVEDCLGFVQLLEKKMATTEAETPVESAKVSDEEVRQAIKDLLKDIDIASTSIREIRTLLQAKLGDRFDVEERKDFVKDTVASFLLEGDEDEDQDPSEADEAEDDENEESVPTAVEVASPDKGKKKSGGFAKPLLLADELAEFMGSKIASRTDVTKKIWEYIKANDLQNPSNRREILCDEAFEKLMKRKKINMFKMTQVLNPVCAVQQSSSSRRRCCCS